MIAVIFYDLDFDVEHDSDSAHIYADVSVGGVYCFDGKEQARAHLDEMRRLHPGCRCATKEVKQPEVEAAERDKYQMRMSGDWS